jgi:ribokinase
MVDVAGVGPALVDYINTIEAYPPIGGHAVIKSSSRMPGGAAGNVIYALSGFGLKCRFYTTIGEDEDGRFYIDEMTKKGVEVKYNITHPLTGRCTIFVDSNGERTFFVQPNASGVLNEGLKSEIVFGLKECDYIYLDPFPSADSFAFHLDVAKEAEKHECKVVLNPGYPYSSMGLEKLKKILNHCSILFLSEFELKVLKADVEIVASMVDLLVVTLGRKGSMANIRW